MTVPRDLEMALLSYNAYVRSPENLLPTGAWGDPILSVDEQNIGFAARVYRVGTQVVIAFRGTDAPELQDFLTGNIPAASGWMSPQVMAAIRLVSDVMAANPNTDLSFTGHSLGGGLASLMAAFFQKEATTFDMAPFGNTAEGQEVEFIRFGVGPIQIPIVRDSMVTLYRYLQEYTAYQQSQGRPVDPAFTQYATAIAERGAVADAMLAFTRANIHGFFLEDEILALVRAVPGLSTLVGTLTPIAIGDTTLNDASINLAEVFGDATALHSQVLLIALMAAPTLQTASQRLPALLEQLLSEDLYSRDPTGPETGFLNRLLLDHFAGGIPAGSTLLTHFAQELLRLGETGSTHLEGIREGLTAAIIEFYNFADYSQTGDFVTVGSNSVTVDLERIPTPEGSEERPDLGSVELTVGLGKLLPLDAPGTRARAMAAARAATQWTVQVGNNGMYTSGRDENEVQIGGRIVTNEMHGGAGNDVLIAGNMGDTLDGGVGNDVLVGGSGVDTLYGGYSGTDASVADDDYIHGGAGADTLIGGRGRDELYGGADFDTYNFFDGDGSDIVIDSDGLGALYYEGEQIVVGERIGENIWRSEDGELTISRHPVSPDTPNLYTVTIRNTTGSTLITVRLWETGRLGLTFAQTPIETEVDPPPVTITIIDPNDPDGTEGYRGSYSADVYGTSANDLVYTRSIVGPGGMTYTATDQGGHDIIIGGEGVDAIYGGAGDDWISGNGSVDYMLGDVEMNTAGNNNMAGGLGSDIIYGRNGRDQIWGDDRIDLYTAIALGNDAESFDVRGDYMHGGNGEDEIVGSNNWDFLSGGAGRDILVGMGGNDLIAGDRVYELTGIYATGELEQPGFAWDWTIQHDIVTQPDGSMIYTLSIRDIFAVNISTPDGGDADIIHAGAGNDGVLAGVGDDFADGGTGDDLLAGEEGNDTLLGGAGNDLLDGGDDSDVSGADLLDGGEGDDQLFGAHGSDTLLGGDGADKLYGDDLDAALSGADFLDGGSGNDQLYGGAKSDTLIGGTGDDVMVGDSGSTPAIYQGDDYLEGGAGRDQMVGGGGSDTLLGGDDDDQIYGDGGGAPDAAHGRDHLEGGAGNDIMVAGGNDDTLYGGDGDDELYGDASDVAIGFHGNDVLDGGNGNDLVVGSGGNDHLVGGEGEDRLHGDSSEVPEADMGHDWLEGGAGNDTLSGYGGNDALFGGADVDTLFGGAGDDELHGGAGDDILQGGAGDDVLRGDEGVDTLRGEDGDDTYVFDNDDLVVVNNTVDGIIDTVGYNRVVLTGLTVDDISLRAGTAAGSLNLQALNGTVGLVVRDAFSNSIAEYIFSDGTAMTAAELIGAHYAFSISRYVTDVNAILFGGSAGDILHALGNNSLLSGGRGYDSLYGGLGSTSYLFGFGDGVDTIGDLSNYDQSSGESVNTLSLASGISLGDLSLHYGSSGLELRIGSAGDGVILTNYDLNDLAGSNRTFDRFEFDDGTSLTWQAFLAQTSVIIESTDASIQGSSVADTVVGGSGNQTLQGNAGNDSLNGAGGNDVLIGGAGDDRYVFVGNWGADSVDNSDDVTNAVETLEFTDIADVSELRFYRYNDDLIVSQFGTANRVTVRGHFLGQGIDQIRLAGGAIIDAATIMQSSVLDQITANADTVYGTQEDDVITTLGPGDVVYGGRGNDTLQGGTTIYGEDGNDILTGNGTAAIYGGAGDDVIDGDALQSHGGDGNDIIRGRDLYGEVGNDTLLGADGGATLQGGAGEDHLVGGTGSDTLLGGDDNDELEGGAGNDELSGGTGVDTLAGGAGDDELDGGDGHDILLGGDGNDLLTGGAGDDALTGGTGNDQLHGGSGSNSYVFAIGDGHDVIVDAYEGEVTIDVSGVPLQNMVFRRDGTNLVITFQSSPGDQLTLSAFFNGETPVSSIRLQYGNAQETLLDPAQVRVLTVAGTDGVDVINGYSGDDVINTLGGDDIVHAGDGHDVVNGGTGNDQLTGGAGNDQLNGGTGNDLLLGGDGIDNLEGGAGTDRTEGGAGDDTYRLAANWGADIVLDSAGSDVISFSEMLYSDFVLRRDGLDLVVTNRGTGDQLRVNGQFSNVAGQAGATAIERLLFSNGPTGISLDYEAIKRKALEGTADADVIYGHADNDVINAGAGNDVVEAGNGDDVVDGGDGNDTLNGGAGDDVLSGGAGDDVLQGLAGNNQLSGGDGVDALHGGAGNDVLSGDAGDDVLDGGSGDDTLRGGDGNDDLTAAAGGNDSLYGEVGNDTLRGEGLLDGGTGDDILEGSGELLGGAGNDTLLGQGFDILRGGAGTDVIEAYSNAWNQGNNTLEGGAGNDTLYGSFGEDTYIFNLGDGHDLLIERRANEAYGNVAATADTLSFGTGIVASDLSFHRRGTDMIIEHANGIDSITIQNWFQEPTDHFKLDHFVFADGSSLSQAQVENQVIHHGTAGVDNFIGYRALNDTMLLGDGNDFAWGRVGNDTLHGEAGNDYLEGEAGTDTLYGGVGNDQLDGGTQNDLLAGGAGDDKYVYALGDGSDTIDNTGGGYDGVFFIGGIGEARLSFGRDGNDLLILVDGDTAQSVRVVGHFLGGDRAISYVQPDGGYSISAARIGHIVAAQGVPGNFETLIDGTSAGEELVGYAGRDLLRGQGGDDDLFGMGGDDQLEGGDGADYLSGGNGSQTASGNDVLIGGNGNDILVGEDGNDTLLGGVGDDAYYYRVGSGVDVIDNTGGGLDRAFFIDIVRSRLSFSRDGNDLVILVDQNLAQQLRVTNHFLGGDYAIDYVQSQDGISLTTAQINQLVSGGLYDQVIEGTAAGEELVGSAGKDLINGLGGDDDLFGMQGNDTLQGGDGADYLAGGNGGGTDSGADRLEGGAGNDTLSGEDGANTLLGGAGNDYYVHGTGQDTIDNTGGGSDGVFFDAAVAVGNLAFTRNGDDLLITVNGSAGNTVRVTNHFLGGDYALDFVQPGSGNMLDTNAINALVGGGSNPGGGGNQGNDADYPNVVTGTAAGEQLLGSNGRDLIRGLGGGDTLFGFGGDDKFDGGDGDDYISGGDGSFAGSGSDILLGGAGDDRLVGEDGNDTLFGGAGNDHYYYRAGSGSDIIDTVGGGTDWVFFISIDPARLGFHRVGNDLIIRVDANANQQVRVLDHFLGGERAISYVQPGSGSAIAAAQIPALLTPLPSASSAMATDGSISALEYGMAADSRAELDNLIAAMASFAPAEASLTEWTPPRTVHYELAASL